MVGGLSNKSTRLAKFLYSKIIKDVFSVSSPEAAETTKLLENTFRLVNIALANEFAMVAERLGINIWEVIEAASTKPFGFMPFFPGPGAGGHCLPCDPVYLSWKAKKLGFKTKMIDLASYINHFMPQYVVERVIKALKDKGIPIREAKILVLGVTYKKDVKDLRESPAIDIIDLLQQKAGRVKYYDPLIPYLKLKGMDFKRSKIGKSDLKKYDCLIIATAHSKIDYDLLRKNSKLIFDTRNIYKKDYLNVVRF